MAKITIKPKKTGVKIVNSERFRKKKIRVFLGGRAAMRVGERWYGPGRG